MTVDACTTCGGAFFDFGELSRLIRQQPEQLGKLDALVKPTGRRPGDDQQRQMIHCPACETGMEPYRYAGSTDIWLNECPQCNGTWADDGELRAIETHAETARQELGYTPGRPRLVPADGLNLPEDRWTGFDIVAAILGRRWLF
jgi:Zn-finger nucleic acid-binding protein